MARLRRTERPAPENKAFNAENQYKARGLLSRMSGSRTQSYRYLRMCAYLPSCWHWCASNIENASTLATLCANGPAAHTSNLQRKRSSYAYQTSPPVSNHPCRTTKTRTHKQSALVARQDSTSDFPISPISDSLILTCVTRQCSCTEISMPAAQINFVLGLNSVR